MKALLMWIALVTTTTVAATSPVVERNETENRDLIVGGQIVDDNAPKYPWFVLPGTGSNICGGSLISRTGVILTAAHCLTGPNSWNSVRIGVVDTAGNPYVGSPANERRDEYNVFQTAIHPLYDSATDPFQYDFALLRVITIPNDVADALVELDINANPSIPNINGNNNELIAMGLGATDSGASPSSIHDVTMPFVDDDACTAEWRASYNASTMVCGGVDNERRGICSGDSGGPVVIQDNGQFLQIGVSSFGSTSCETISVFARVSFASDWINEVACDWSRDDKFCRAGDTEPPVTNEPTAAPVDPPTALPTVSPVELLPTAAPTVAATAPPTNALTASPVDLPTALPTVTPSAPPTASPTNTLTANPTSTPTANPTSIRTTESPVTLTLSPTVSNIAPETNAPTVPPTRLPTAVSPAPSPAVVAATESPVEEATGTPTQSPIGGFNLPGDTFSPTTPPNSATPSPGTESPTATPQTETTSQPVRTPTQGPNINGDEPTQAPDIPVEDPTLEPVTPSPTEEVPTVVPVSNPTETPEMVTVAPSTPTTGDTTEAPVDIVGNPVNDADLTVLVQFDGFPDDLNFTIVSDTLGVIYEGPDYTASPYQLWNTTLTGLELGEYSLVVSDKGGDGLLSDASFEGRIELYIDGVLISRLAGDFGANSETAFTVGNVDPVNPPMMPSPSPSSQADTDNSDDNHVRIQIQFDGYPEEVKWKIKYDGDAIYKGPDDYEPKPFETWSTRFNVIPAGKYKFVMQDQAGDGLVTGNYTGFVRITQYIDGTEFLLKRLKGSFRDKLKKSFVVMDM